MATKLANAFPKKSFFIQMFVKDISLEGCVLDLLDNSIDGLIRSGKVRLSKISQGIFRKGHVGKRRKGGLRHITLTYSEDAFEVKDDCGGIGLNYALNEAFNFGHSPKAGLGYLGVYGIGLKRALFKIGGRFHIKSQTVTDGFKMELDVDKWLAREDTMEDWKMPLQPISGVRSQASAGTLIRITNLREEAKLRLKDGIFDRELYDAISKTYAFFLGEYVRVRVNGETVEPFSIPIGRLPGGQTSFEKFEERGVKVTIIATVARQDERGRLAQERAGWYIACNGRVVLAADKSERSGWNTGPMPQFQPKHRAFVGFVFFESEDPLKLPWTTTKRDLNKESPIYLYTKNRMAAAARPVIAFCNRKYGADRDDEPIEREIAKEVKPASIGELTSRKATAFTPPERVKRKVKLTTSVQYEAKNSDLTKVRKHLRKPSMGANRIGEYTFRYFLRQEGLL